LAPELRHLTATLILDLEDAYARARGTRGLHPRPIGAVRYELLGQIVAGQRETFDEPSRLVVQRNGSGYDLFFGEVRLRDGSRRQVIEGSYALRVTSPTAYYQASERDIAFPSPETPVFFDLQPGVGYPFPTETLPGGRGPTLLRGTYFHPNGTGIVGVIIQVPGRTNPFVTDQTGQWVLAFPDDEPTGVVTVRFQSAGGMVETIPEVVVVGGRESSLSQTALRGWTLNTTGGPIDAATISVSGQPDEVRSRSDGSWIFYFPLGQQAAVVTVTASLPDGRTQIRPNIQVLPRSTTRVPTFQF
jgi:hypothetical protein